MLIPSSLQEQTSPRAPGRRLAPFHWPSGLGRHPTHIVMQPDPQAPKAHMTKRKESNDTEKSISTAAQSFDCRSHGSRLSISSRSACNRVWFTGSCAGSWAKLNTYFIAVGSFYCCPKPRIRGLTLSKNHTVVLSASEHNRRSKAALPLISSTPITILRITLPKL